MKRFFIGIKYFVDSQLMNHILLFAGARQRTDNDGERQYRG